MPKIVVSGVGELSGFAVATWAPVTQAIWKGENMYSPTGW